jgi:hypothetical protein
LGQTRMVSSSGNIISRSESVIGLSILACKGQAIMRMEKVAQLDPVNSYNFYTTSVSHK